jgi:hypothetical protein
MNLDLLDPKVIALAVLMVLVIVVIGVLYIRKRRAAAAELRQRFGTEYDRAVKEHGSQRKAEAKLEDREKRVEKLNIRELDALERERFSKQWASIQARFIDSPRGAVTEADDLVSSVMQTRGYPIADFNLRAADISVGHPLLVVNYRLAHEIVQRFGKAETTTEELRTAMIHYRSLFDELAHVPVSVVVERKEVA